MPDAPLDTDAPAWALAWSVALVQERLRSTIRVRSNEVNTVFRLAFETCTLFLKIGPTLQSEHERLRWLEGRLPCPRPVGFTTQRGTEAILMSAVEGDDLAVLSASLPPQVIVTRLAAAIRGVHAVTVMDWPFGGDGTTLVHGDACLPNFLYCGDDLSGYIDIGEMRLGEPEIDLPAVVWSLQYNLGPGHGLSFLREYGVMDADEEEVERLRLSYE